jgi:assimilatory nitrate reductase catalytic subunit
VTRPSRLRAPKIPNRTAHDRARARGPRLAAASRTVKTTAVTVDSHCPFCALQCGMHLVPDDGGLSVLGNAKFPVNEGGLCVKGWSAAATLARPDRLRTPLVRDDDGSLVPASWEAALARIVERIRAVQRSHGPDAVAVFGGGSLTNEKAYLLGKFARVALGTANVDYNGRFCMSSAAAAASRAFGTDRGLPFPVSDIAGAGAILLVGSNAAETMPPIMRYFEAQQLAGGRLIVADPRRTPTAQWASCHLALKPGSDAALANGLLHVLVRDSFIDEDYISRRTEGFADALRVSATYWPERVEQIAGVPEALLVEAARTLGRAERAMILTSRGPEQQAQGVQNTLAYINLALALGSVGRPFSGYGTLTGQGNGQGGREHGQKADQLPGCRSLQDPAARAHVARIWDVAESAIPGPGRSAFEQIDSIGSDGGVHALFVMGSNIAVSAPDGLRVAERLKALDFLVVSDFFLSETARVADVVLPSAQWAEEDGTMTNLEGRVIRRRRAADPPAGVKTDLDILCAVASALGRRRHFSYAGARDVFDELRAASAGGAADYSGITYERIDAEDGVFWPCPGIGHPGTPRLFADTFPTPSGRAKFHGVFHQPPVDDRDSDHPLYLTTGRVLAQYQSGTQTRRIDALQKAAPAPLAEMHPSTAKRHRLADGEPVTLTTRRAAATFTLKVTAAIREDTVFVPFHWGGIESINRLTSAALDPVSGMPELKVCAVRASLPAPEGTPWAPGAGSSSSATAWRVRASSRSCWPGAAAIAIGSPCSATSRAATTTASCCPACWRGATTRRTSSSTRCRGTPRTASRFMPACGSRQSTSPRGPSGARTASSSGTTRSSSPPAAGR